MNLKTLGSSDLKVSPIGFGTMHLGVTVDFGQCHYLLDRYSHIPGAFIDTANIYSLNNPQGPFHERGQSEQFIGSWLKNSGKRKQVILATKVLNDMKDGFAGLSKKSIAYQIDQSLKRLNTDYVDLYQIHGFDEGVPMEETIRAMNEVLSSGKARFIGCSNLHHKQIKAYQDLAEHMGLEGFVSYQNSFNLVLKNRMRNSVGNFLLNQEELKELGVGLIGYRTLVNGFLAGKYRPHVQYNMDSESQKAVERNCFNDNGWHLLMVLEEIAVRKSATTMQVALAAHRLDPLVAISLVGFSKVAQIDEAESSLSLSLDADDLTRIEEASLRMTSS